MSGYCFGELYVQNIVGFLIMVNGPIYRDHPDIVAVDKLANQSYFIDVTIPGNVCMKTKTTEKL